MVGLLPLCAATVFDGQADGEVPGTRRAVPGVPRRASRAVRGDPRPEKAGRRRPAAGFDPRRNQAPPRAGEDARRKRVPQPVRPPLAVALPRRPSLRHARRRPGVPRFLSAGGVGHRHVRRQLELARPDLDAGQRPDHPGLAAVLHLLRRRLHRRMSHRLRPADESVSGGRGDLAPAGQHLPARTRTAGGRSTAAPASSRTIRTGATACCSTSTSTATTAPASAPAIRPAGPGSSPG